MIDLLYTPKIIRPTCLSLIQSLKKYGLATITIPNCWQCAKYSFKVMFWNVLKLLLTRGQFKRKNINKITHINSKKNPQTQQNVKGLNQ